MLGLLLAVPATALIGAVLEITVLRTLYAREHLDQVLATFGLILFFNELVKIVWGPSAVFLSPPAWLAGQVTILPGVTYPAIRLAIIVVGLAVALVLWLLIARTRLGMQIRAGASNRDHGERARASTSSASSPSCSRSAPGSRRSPAGSRARSSRSRSAWASRS